MICPKCGEESISEYNKPSSSQRDPEEFFVSVIGKCKNGHQFGKMARTTYKIFHDIMDMDAFLKRKRGRELA